MPPSSPVPAHASASRRILVTGGAGFIGASLALGLAARNPDWEVLALDNLRRRGSELNLPRLRTAGVRFAHGDVRELDDLLQVGGLDALVECSAEPSVMAGVDGSPDYVVQANLIGAYNCLELARRTRAQFLFLSTSRVYPVAPLEHLAYREDLDTRFEPKDEQPVPGALVARESPSRFPPGGRPHAVWRPPSSPAELLIAEYAARLRTEDDDQPLRRGRRALADGQG